jgi:hypothetical protein
MQSGTAGKALWAVPWPGVDERIKQVSSTGCVTGSVTGSVRGVHFASFVFYLDVSQQGVSAVF